MMEMELVSMRANDPSANAAFWVGTVIQKRVKHPFCVG